MLADKLRNDIEYKNLVARNLISLTEGEKQKVLEMRNHEDIRKWMKNENEIRLKDHLNFINNLRVNNHNFYWLVLDKNNGDQLGVIYINRLEEEQGVCEFGVYGNPFLERKGKGTELATMELYIIFQVAELNEVMLEVKKENGPALKLYEKLGFEIMGEEDGYSKLKLTKIKYSGNKE